VDEPQTMVPWTILVYGHGDHNLSNSLLRDMREMQAATLGEAVQVLVVADFNSSLVIAGSDDVYFPEGVGLYRVLGDNADLALLANGDEANLDDPEVLADLVGTVFKAFPSERRGLILWDHGGGWEGGFGSDTQNGTVENPEPMSVQDVALGVRTGLKRAGLKTSETLDFFAFDTCLLGAVEAAFAFKDVAKVYIADAEIDYGNGWDYERSFSNIAAHPSASTIELARSEVSHWDAHHAEAGADDALLRSHIALDLSKMNAFAEAIGVFSTRVIQDASTDPVEFARGSFFALPPYSSEFASGSNIPGLRDVGQLLSKLGTTATDSSVAEAAQTAVDALDQLVVAQSQGTLRSLSGQVGLSIEQTLGAQLTQGRLAAYGERASEWVAASHWDQVLAFAAAFADTDPPIFEHAVLNAEEPTSAAPPTLEFTTADPAGAKADVNLATYLPDGSIAVLGLIGTGLLDGAGTYNFAWDGALFSFDDTQPAALQIWLDAGVQSNATVFAVPGVLRSASGEWLVQLVLGSDEDTATALVVWEGDNPSTWSVAELVAELPDATFTPVYSGVDGATGDEVTIEGAAMSVPASGFSLTSRYQAAGDYVFITTLSDVWGNSSSEIDGVTLTASLEP
jgi:Clostripain family